MSSERPEQAVPGQRIHVRQALRRATATAHHVLDHHPLMQQLVDRDLTRAPYAESLAAMYLPHVRLERLVHESPHHFDSGFALSPRLETLQADLLELGQPVPVVSHAPQAQVESRAAWWGRVYVLEGSRQGAAFIARHVHSTLGNSVPCRFFDEAARQTNHDALLAILERELVAPDDLEEAKASAMDAFASYSAGLDAFSNRGTSKES